jgi:squalene-associated FAD-dependent desaturase
MARIHVIGAGLSGLGAAVGLSGTGARVAVYDAAGHAGGRCRSFYDRTLDRRIDNGNHLVMSGNGAVFRFLDRIGSKDALVGPDSAAYPFVDVKSGARWTIRLNDGLLPFWILDPKSRVPETRFADYLKAAGIAAAPAAATVADVVDREGPLYKAFFEPLTLAVLNTTPERGSARLLWSVIRETFARGGRPSRPRVARTGLSEAFIDPAVAFLAKGGGEVRLNMRLRGIEFARLEFPEGAVEVAPEDSVILAVPPSRLRQLVPELDPPDDDASILNVHYRLRAPLANGVMNGSPFLGIVSADAQWAFVRGDVVSLTVSAAHAIGMDDVPNERAVQDLWRETQVALRLENAPFAAVRVIRERRATPDQSPAAVRKRVKAKTRWRNLFLAGDHTDTGVPATIEGALRSGETAARLARKALRP